MSVRNTVNSGSSGPADRVQSDGGLSSGGGDPAFALDAFVSYSRVDAEYVYELVHAAGEAGRTLWIDRDGIPPGAPWREELGSAIEAALAFVVVLSPHWLQSTECRLEYDRAVSLGKRIIPVQLQECEPPEEISILNWIDARQAAPEQVVSALLTAIDTDHEWVKQHTTWLSRALRWENGARDRSLLLRGSDLIEAEEWLSRDGAPSLPTSRQELFIETSRRDVGLRRRRRMTAIASAGLVVAVLAVVAAIELVGKTASHRQSQSRALASKAISQIGTDPERSLLLSRAAWQISPTAQAAHALEVSVAASHVRLAVGGLPPGGSGVAWGDGGRAIVAAGGDRLGAWDAVDGHSKGTLVAGSGKVIRLAADSAGTRGVAATTGGQAILWQLSPSSGTLRRVATLASRGAAEVAISADGSVAAVKSSRGEVTVVRPASRSRRVLRLRGETGSGCLALSDDGRAMLIGGRSGAVLWRAHDHLFRVAGTTTPTVGCASSAAGSIVFTSAEDGSGTVWSAAGDRVLKRVSNVFAAALSPDGHRLVTTDISGDVRVYDLVHHSARTLQSHGAIEDVAAFSTDGSAVAVGGSDGTAWVWRAAGGPGVALRGSTGNVSAVAFSPDGRSLLSTDGSGIAHTWALRAAPVPLRVSYTHSSAAHVAAIALAGAGGVAVTAGQTVWSSSTSTGRTACPAGAPCDREPELQTELLSALAGANSTAIAVNPSGGEIAVGSEHGSVSIFDARTARRAASLTTVGGYIDQLEFSPDGARLAASGQLGKAVLINPTNGQVVASLARGDSNVNAVGFTPDGRIVTADSDGSVWLWDRSGHLVRRVAALRSDILAIAVDPSGGMVAVGINSQIDVLRLSDGHVMARLDTNGGPITALAYVGRTGLLASGGIDRRVTVWDPRTGEQAQSFTVPSSVTGLAVSQSRRIIAVATQNTGGYVLHCDVCVGRAALLRAAAQQSTRALTAHERAEFGVPKSAVVQRCKTGCGSLASASTKAVTVTPRTEAARLPLALATAAAVTSNGDVIRAEYIKRADALCQRSDASLAPILKRMGRDIARDGTKPADDTPANRNRLGLDYASAATVLGAALVQLRALSLPRAGRADAERYLAGLAFQVTLLRHLAKLLSSPVKPGPTPAYTALTTEIASTEIRERKAQIVTDRAARAFGFHVCGVGS